MAPIDPLSQSAVQTRTRHRFFFPPVISNQQNHIPRRPPWRSSWGRLVPVAIALVVSIPLVSALFVSSARADDDVHVVARGENISAIADQYNVSVREILAVNGISDPNLVHVGQRLVIPGLAAARRYTRPAATDELPGDGGYVTVARGETLEDIAQQYDMTTEDLMRLNGLGQQNFVSAGQTLRLSARVTPVALPEKTEPKLVAAESIYVVQPGETLEAIAAAHGLTTQELLVANGLPHPRFIWAGQQLRIGKLVKPEMGLHLEGAPADGYRWIEVDLSEQTLTAWQGDVPVLHTSVSTGTARYPTVTGRFAVGTKYRSQRMSGPGYDLPGVPWVMYFFGGYAIHGAYWHNNFGTPMSHGCVNMRVEEAEFLYDWADAGTEVDVHR